MPGQQQPEKKNKASKGTYHVILKYSGLAFQMIAIVLICTYAGYKLDEYLELSIPVFTILFIIAGLFGFLYSLIRSFK